MDHLKIAKVAGQWLKNIRENKALAFWILAAVFGWGGAGAQLMSDAPKIVEPTEKPHSHPEKPHTHNDKRLKRLERFH